MKILLNKRKSKTSVNKNSKMFVDLGNEMKKISDFSDSHTVDLYQLYLDEKDASNKYRLIFTINPLCTNVLFNAITEVVYKEGSDECKDLSDGTFDDAVEAISNASVDRLQAIRDTEYSHPLLGGLTYLPGVDMFNNHLLRQNGLHCVQKRSGLYGQGPDVFNTIRDYQRKTDGTVVKKKFPGEDSTYSKPIIGVPHLYQEADIVDFEETFMTKIKEDKGWFGFYNPATLEIPVKKIGNTDVYINKLLNDRNACDFIDMFPGRDRFTFVPHRNPYRNNRLEKNWDYCLTYPYRSTIHMINGDGEDKESYNEIVSNEDGSVNGLRFIASRSYVTDSDRERVLIQSIDAHHNLDSNSKIILFYEVDGEQVKTKEIRVRGLGNLDGEYPGYFFSIDAEDVRDWFDSDDKLKNNISGRLAKSVFGVPCKYYFRVHRRIPNLNNSEENDFQNELNKLAFANNIYGDNIVQLIYLEDIDLTELVDNLGRPLTDIYLTIIKCNAGHKEWYEENNKTSENITIARAFGKVTSGIDIPYESGFSKNYNVRRIHNINNPSTNVSQENIGLLPLEDDIQGSGEFFLGDLVEFSVTQYQETILEEIYHRFNTAQRELENLKYEDIVFDEIVADDYDSNPDGVFDDNFRCETKIYNKDGELNCPGNLFPEGYYYKPHYRIHVKDISSTIAQSSDTQVPVDNVVRSGNRFTFICLADYDLTFGDAIVIQNLQTKECYEAIVTNMEDTVNITANTVGNYQSNDTDAQYVVFKKTIGIPGYAVRLPDTSGKYVWRAPVPPSTLGNDSELHNVPFTNGAHYHHIGINFFLRRQDPYGDYNLNYDGGVDVEKNKLNNIKIMGSYNEDIYNNDIIQFGLLDIC